MTVLIRILQVIVALSTLIVIHEAGHFTFAKLFGVRVEKFYLFFDVGGRYLFSTKRSRWFAALFPRIASSETDYGIGWLPLGGYCKISGMVDESLDTEALSSEPKPWEFRTKPVWKRLLVMAGGVLYNFIFAIIAYAAILSIWGETYLSNSDNRIYASELAREMGFRTGDRILRFDDYVPDDFGMLQADLARRDVRKATVLRDGDTLDIYIDQSLIPKVLSTPAMFDVAVPFVIDTLLEGSVNAGAGILGGDRVIAVEGTPVEFVQDSRPIFSLHAGDSVSVTLLRAEDTLGMKLRVDSLGRIGVITRIPSLVTRSYSFLSAIPAGAVKTGSTMGGYLRDLKLVFTPRTEAYKSVGSFIAIGQAFPERWMWYPFLNLLAVLSIMLGVMNLLPIPGLDGGHIAFGLYELFTGRKPSDRFMMAAQLVGMFLLVALMILAFGNDIGRLIR